MLEPRSRFKIGDRWIGHDDPTFFVADIAANHDGDLSRAVDLIHLAAAAGADAAKFQHFKATTIVSDFGFKALGAQRSHQGNWKKPVFEVYEDAAVDLEWTSVLKDACETAGITFFTSPYAMNIVDQIDAHVPAYKIGSGEITWIELIRYIAAKGKPCMIATGASTMEEVDRAVSAVLEINPDLVLMQCNTNYTADIENLKHIHLNVLRTYRKLYPEIVLGLSDHSHGHSAALGAIALGARVIEKHFTDDTSRDGPDHGFSMIPTTWSGMVNRSRELEAALGAGVKKVEDNEKETVILQRRCIRAARALPSGVKIGKKDLMVLRPCPPDGLPPFQVDQVAGRKLRRSLREGQHITWADLS